jgi:hypothetical protein
MACGAATLGSCGPGTDAETSLAAVSSTTIKVTVILMTVILMAGTGRFHGIVACALTETSFAARFARCRLLICLEN